MSIEYVSICVHQIDLLIMSIFDTHFAAAAAAATAATYADTVGGGNFLT